MSVKTHANTWSRRAALQVLYSAEITGRPLQEILDEGPCVFEDDDASEPAQLDSYALRLLQGVLENCEELDALIDPCSENWTVARMPIMDRSVIRLATYEMLHVDEVPISVSINEAVDLAKEFGVEDESHRFVNGVLGQIAKKLEVSEADA